MVLQCNGFTMPKQWISKMISETTEARRVLTPPCHLGHISEHGNNFKLLARSPQRKMRREARSPQKSVPGCQRFTASLCPNDFWRWEEDRGSERANFFPILLFFATMIINCIADLFKAIKDMFQEELCHRITVCYWKLISQCICPHHLSYS